MILNRSNVRFTSNSRYLCGEEFSKKKKGQTDPNAPVTTELENAWLQEVDFEQFKADGGKVLLGAACADNEEFEKFKGAVANIAHFHLKNMLVRRLAGAMLLEKQKRWVKASALMGRVICMELPGRMKEKRQKDSRAHIPYYYTHYTQTVVNRNTTVGVKSGQ